ncbi:NADPH:quinone oxidoreductase family protein [Albimonas sp. CAU 1670]|uniref:NADPH:quinone oxidoreductase family protein n=1 Tax=Albimonas sp. CAU 1670 TaxID=3032599 RepID=UPI0023DB47E1|nr:NADPH:quinone oxidoreductase family protein [Albimonas sp. CAU 1670]MDF2234981.1 NADPH:quinone oxidoreductase family protein [Albimonas sp. CAU 1670]
MKAIQAASLESIDAYGEVDLPTPRPGPGELRLRVACCGVGYVDALVSLGRYQVKPPLPHVPGGEVAGVVEALGEGVSGLAPGDRVMAKVTGGFAEFAVATAADVRRIPDAMSLAQAAGFRVNYITALHGLRDRGRLAPGETLLVIGAAGGTGMAAVQVGKALGARVIAVASTPEKRAAAEAAGADASLDREPEGWRERLKALAPEGLDMVFDPVSGPLMQPAFRSLRWGGRHLVIGFAGGEIPALPVNLPLLKGASLVGVDYRQFSAVFEPAAAEAELDELLAWVAEGRLSPPVGRSFAFADHKACLEFALSGAGSAKTLLTVDPSLS